MTKSEYLSNSAKLLDISSALLLVANFITSFGAGSEVLVGIGQKLSSVSFYVVMVLGFLAFNGEGIAYKRSRDHKNKKFTSVLKLFLVYAFVFRFFKTLVENALIVQGADDLKGFLASAFCGILNAVASYGFLLTLVSLWYILRDFSVKKLFAVESASLLVGCCYNMYKLFNYVVVKYGFMGLGEGFSLAFSNEVVLHSLCVLQYLANLIMFIFVMRHYSLLAASERETHKKIQKKLLPARSIYKSECVGIDTLDDDFQI